MPKPQPAYPVLEPPPMNPHIRYWQARVREAQERIDAGLHINFEQAKADWCALRLVRIPPVKGVMDKKEAPAEKATEGELMKQLGF